MTSHRSLRAMAVMLSLVVAGGCGGSSPGSPTPVPSPSPTPRPPLTITLTAEADHFRFSSRLMELAIGQSFDVAFTPIGINEAEGSRFAHTIEFWVTEQSGNANTADHAADGLALSLAWLRGEWWLSSRTPETGYRSTNQRVPMAFGEQHTIRIVRHGPTVVEFLLDGTRALVLDGSRPSGSVYARVVGAEASFSYSVE